MRERNSDEKKRERHKSAEKKTMGTHTRHETNAIGNFHGQKTKTKNESTRIKKNVKTGPRGEGSKGFHLGRLQAQIDDNMFPSGTRPPSCIEFVLGSVVHVLLQRCKTEKSGIFQQCQLPIDFFFVRQATPPPEKHNASSTQENRNEN